MIVRVLGAVLLALAGYAGVAAAQTAPGDGPLFSLSGDHGVTAEIGRIGTALRPSSGFSFAWPAAGNIHAQAGTLSFFVLRAQIAGRFIADERRVDIALPANAPLRPAVASAGDATPVVHVLVPGPPDRGRARSATPPPPDRHHPFRPAPAPLRGSASHSPQ